MIDFGKLELIQFSQQLDDELAVQSDRGLAVLGSAGLEYLLEQLLFAHLLDENNLARDLFRGNGPLSTFSSRIALSYALGLISRDEHAELDIVRRIRNSLTHTVGHASLASQGNRDLCRNLQLGERLYAPPVIPFATLPNGERGIPADPADYPLLPPEAFELPNKSDPRARFAASIHALTRVLAGRASTARRAVTPSEFSGPEEPLSQPMSVLQASLDELANGIAKLVELRDRLLSQGKDLPPELVNIPGTSAEDVLSDRQMRLLFQMGTYSNEVIRRSRLAHVEPSGHEAT